jgi:hypothetical protein
MVFDKPAVVASFLTSCFACDAEGKELSGIETLARGVVDRGTFDALRDGVNGADVGTKRDGAFAGAS